MDDRTDGERERERDREREREKESQGYPYEKRNLKMMIYIHTYIVQRLSLYEMGPVTKVQITDKTVYLNKVVCIVTLGKGIDPFILPTVMGELLDILWSLT